MQVKRKIKKMTIYKNYKIGDSWWRKMKKKDKEEKNNRKKDCFYETRDKSFYRTRENEWLHRDQHHSGLVLVQFVLKSFCLHQRSSFCANWSNAKCLFHLEYLSVLACLNWQSYFINYFFHRCWHEWDFFMYQPVLWLPCYCWLLIVIFWIFIEL